MRSFTCKKCLRVFRVHVGAVPRDRVCVGCKFPAEPAPPKGAPLTFADLDPGERRRYPGSGLALR